MRRKIFSATAGTALLSLAAACLTATGSAVAAPPSTLTLTGGASGQANNVTLLSAGSGGILYDVYDPAAQRSTEYLREADGTTTSLNGTPLANESASVVGDLVGAYDYSNHEFIYRSVDGTRSGTAPVTGASFAGVSPDGYFSTSAPDGINVHLYDTDVTTPTTTDLGAVPGNPVQVMVTPGTGGVLVETSQQDTGWGPRSLYYRSYGATGSYVQLADEEPLYGLPALNGNSAAWLENPGILTGDDENFPYDKTSLVAVKLDGTGRWSMATPDTGEMVVAGDYIGWVTIPGQSQQFATVPITGGSATTFATPVSWQLGSTGDAFVVDELGTPASAGLYRVASAGDTGTQLVAAGAATLRADSISLAPGRAVWSDNGIGANLWARDLSLDEQSPPAISAGSPQAISPTATAQQVSASGGRIAYFDTDPATYGRVDLWLQNPDGSRQQLDSNSDAYASVTVSGTRALENNSDGSAVLYDLVHHTSTSLPAPSNERSMSPDINTYQISGDDLASIAADGSVWVKNLLSGVKVQVSPALITTGQWVQGNVAIAGDNVAWLVYKCDRVSQFVTECLEAAPVQYRNFRTLAPTYTLDGVYAPDFDISENYLAFPGYVGSVWSMQVNPLYTDTVETIGTIEHSSLFRQYTLSGSMVGWIGADGLPQVQALDQLPEPPRYLGNGIAAPTLVGDGNHTWTADLVTSAALRTCGITVYQQETAVRSIPCDPALMNYGEATATWDGKDADGNVVPAGSYTWVLSAANADGNLLDPNGGSGAVEGALTVTSPSTGGGGGGGGGGGSTSGTVDAGGTVWSGEDPDANDPVTVGVTTPSGGTIDINAQPDTSPEPGNRGVDAFTITAPAASTSNPLHLTFKVFLGDLPTSSVPADLQLFRDGVAIAACSAGVAATTASPDPCITHVSVSGDVATLNVLSSHASSWQVGTADVGRVAGDDRFATAAAISAAAFPSGHAGAVVLASADSYPDALVGAPLAARHNAPVLLTSGTQLPPATKAELERVLPAGGTVYVLGGTAAVPAGIETELTTLGYQATRMGGSDRFSTATAVADALGDPSTVLLASGRNFPDALAAGPAAAARSGAVLLTDGSTLPAATSGYLAAHASAVYAIGGPAAHADPQATAIVGSDRWETAAAVARTFFTIPGSIGVASGENYPDALAAGAWLAAGDAPLLLTGASALPSSTTSYVGSLAAGTQVHVFGGPVAVSAGVQQALVQADS